MTTSESARSWRRPRISKWIWICLILGFMGDLLWTFQRFPALSRGRVFSSAEAPAFGAPALVLGAGVYSGGEPTAVLEGRLQTALSLYREGKINWFLVSGDNRAASYNEPQAMRRWLLRQGVPGGKVIPDYAGRRTYDSLKRAKVIFGLDRIVVVTSDFHMARALYLADHLGIDAYGVPDSTQEETLGTRVLFWVREYFARHKALIDTWFPPATRLGPREQTPDDPVLEKGNSER